MVRVILLLASLGGLVACATPQRQVIPALDPTNPDAPESPPPPPRAVTIELTPPEPPTSAPPQSQPPPPAPMPADHHMHHMHHMPPTPDTAPKTPTTPPPGAGKTKPMDHSMHGGSGGGS